MTDSKSKRGEFAKKYSYEYRLALIALFREAILEYKTNNHELGLLKNVIQDMSYYSNKHPDDLKGNFSKKLDNIILGRTDGSRVEDFEHIEHIEKFILHNLPHKISTLCTYTFLQKFDFFLKAFWSNLDLNIPTLPSFNYPDTLRDIQRSSDPDHFAEDNKRDNYKDFIYEVILENNEYTQDEERYYFYAEVKEQLGFTLCTFFKDSKKTMFHYGVYDTKKRTSIMRSARTGDAIMMNIDKPDDSYIASIGRQNHTFVGGGIKFNETLFDSENNDQVYVKLQVINSKEVLYEEIKNIAKSHLSKLKNKKVDSHT